MSTFSMHMCYFQSITMCLTCGVKDGDCLKKRANEEKNIHFYPEGLRVTVGGHLMLLYWN